MARLIEVLVLPAPPLPLVTAITLTGRGRAMRRSPSACSTLVLVSKLYYPSARGHHHFLLAQPVPEIHEDHALVHPPVGAGEMQILLDALAVTELHERQATVEGGAQH